MKAVSLPATLGAALLGLVGLGVPPADAETVGREPAAATAYVPANPPANRTGRYAGIGADGLPVFCSANNEARGAAIGAQRGAATGLPKGAEIGATRGAAKGARMDALCRMLALPRAAQKPAPGRPAAAVVPAAAAPRAHVAAAAPAATHHGHSPPTSGGSRPIEDGVSLEKSRRAAAALHPAAGPAARERCMISSEVNFASDSEEVAPVTGRVCRGADGRLHEM